MIDISKDMSDFFKSKGISQREIAKTLGTTPQYINALFKGRTKIGKAQAEKLENSFGLSAYWLLTGKGSMLVEDEKENQPDLFMMDESNIEYDNPNEADISAGLKKRQLEALIIKFANGNKKRFASLLGIPTLTITIWEARETFDAELIYQKLPDISAEWLLTGEGPMLVSERVKKDKNAVPQPLNKPVIDADRIREVPRQEEAGQGQGMINEKHSGGIVDKIETMYERMISVLKEQLKVSNDRCASLEEQNKILTSMIHGRGKEDGTDMA